MSTALLAAQGFSRITLINASEICCTVLNVLKKMLSPDCRFSGWEPDIADYRNGSGTGI
jgi:hypothetical protein